MDAIESAAGELEAGDIFFFTYSGHGGQVPDTNDEEEGDSSDETWLAYDRQIVDDELYALWAKFKPGVRILVLSDSCHSGSVNKGIANADVFRTGRDGGDGRQAESALPGAAARQDDRDLRANTTSSTTGSRSRSPSSTSSASELGATVLLISGLPGRPALAGRLQNGAFTAKLLEVWDDGAWHGGYPAFHEAIRSRMPDDQQPNYNPVGASNPDFEQQNPFTRLDAAAGGGAVPRKAMRDVVVCIPGITGSVLRKDGRDVWNISGGALISALTTLGRSITDLKLEDDPPDVDDLGDGITAPEVIRDVHLIPGLWKIDGYTKMLRYIEETFDVTRGRNLFEFPYDWRRDNRVAARRLQRQAGEWLKAWRESSGAADAKLVLVGHSMGGLISRYFLECLDGWRDTRTLVTFGTPYRGSVNALDTLVNGKKIKFFDLTEVARSFTAIYQLLPTYPCYVDGGAEPAHVDEADIPQPGPGEGQGGARLPSRDRRRRRRDTGTIPPTRGRLRPRSNRRVQAADTAVGRARRRSGQAPADDRGSGSRRRRHRAPAVGDAARVRGRPGRDVLGRTARLAAERRPPAAPAHGRPDREHDRLDAVPATRSR